MQNALEAAWEEAKAGGAGSLENYPKDQDLEALWEEGVEGKLETLEGVWSRTAAKLEAGEDADLTENKETPYELSSDNRFSELSDPFSEGVRLFEGGQISDAALCFEAEIARNPENSQVIASSAFGGFGAS